MEVYHDIISESGEINHVSFVYYINMYTTFPYLIKMMLLHMNGEIQDIKRRATNPKLL